MAELAVDRRPPDLTIVAPPAPASQRYINRELVKATVAARYLHELRGLISGPCSLRFIEHYDTLVGWVRIP